MSAGRRRGTWRYRGISMENSGHRGVMQVNLHPALLPEGRGPWPMPTAILRGKSSGVTLHKLAEESDARRTFFGVYEGAARPSALRQCAVVALHADLFDRASFRGRLLSAGACGRANEGRNSLYGRRIRGSVQRRNLKRTCRRVGKAAPARMRCDRVALLFGKISERNCRVDADVLSESEIPAQKGTCALKKAVAVPNLRRIRGGSRLRRFARVLRKGRRIFYRRDRRSISVVGVFRFFSVFVGLTAVVNRFGRGTSGPIAKNWGKHDEKTMRRGLLVQMSAAYSSYSVSVSFRRASRRSVSSRTFL